ncbi:MAG: thiamine diphosphokinase [Gammaproteobacteria bacterium]|nr:thiamine diphosphokinase [Gammaproteobacteria bacterium]
MNIAIVANGEFIFNAAVDSVLRHAEMVIAADNGGAYCLKHGILPDVLIGDFDSLPPHLLQELKIAETVIIEYPKEKNASDLELALDYALEHAATEITVLGGLGNRWDMSLSTLFLLSNPRYERILLTIVTHDQRLLFVNPLMPLLLTGQPGDIVSLLPLTPIVNGIETDHLHYPLSNETLYASSTRGVSNRLTDNSANVRVKEGVLLCIHTPQS